MLSLHPRKNPVTENIFSVLFLASLLSSSACGPAEPEETANATTSNATAIEAAVGTRVETARIAPSEASLSIRLPGEVKGSRDAMLAAPLGGYVERVLVSEGEEVRRNQVLVRVDTATHGAQLAQARVQLETAEREAARAERLGDAIPAQQRDQASSALAAARAALRSARVMSSRTVIRAPFAGTIASMNVEQGEVAPPGQPLIRLVKLDPVHVTLAVPDRDVVALRQGMGARVRAGANGNVFDGTIRFISPAANLQTRAFDVEIEVEGAEGLLPGMIAQVEIERASAGAQLVIPQDVLVTRLSGNGVFVAEGDTAHWRSVETGTVMRDQIVITSGIRAGDELIVTGHRELADGDAIVRSRAGNCCTEGRITFGGNETRTAAPSESSMEGTGEAS